MSYSAEAIQLILSPSRTTISAEPGLGFTHPISQRDGGSGLPEVREDAPQKQRDFMRRQKSAAQNE